MRQASLTQAQLVDNTENLALPYIMPSQSQKHVTHNEALRALDAVVQLAVADKDLGTPPSSPAPGARYIVGAGPTGAWSGHASDVAAWQDGAWAFYTPVAGWLAWVHDESRLYLYSGGGWTEAPGGGGSGLVPKGAWSGAVTYNAGDLVEHEGYAFLSNTDGNLNHEPDAATPGSTAEWTYFSIVTGGGGGGGGGDVNPVPLVGINDIADTTNRLAVSSPASLLSHEGDDHRLKINKAAAGDTASVVFQTDFVGHAEFGLAGDNDWHVKVSPDGTTWHEAIVVNRATGAVSLPNTASGGGGGGRALLTANRTYYVRTDGSDSNDGLSNSSGGAFLTIQKAIDVVGGLDTSIYDVTISIASGTYTTPIVLKNFVGAGLCTLTCPSGTAVISVTGSNAIRGTLITSRYRLGAGIRIQTTTSGSCIYLEKSALQLEGCEFGACASVHVVLDSAWCYVLAGYTISGSAAQHILASTGSQFIYLGGLTIALTGTPAFNPFVNATLGSVVRAAGLTFSGSATGSRYSATLNGAISSGGNPNYFPGNAAGSVATGGQYA